jgi:ABC-type Zn2+ transport system substrate-binding protein/surface adhesin
MDLQGSSDNHTHVNDTSLDDADDNAPFLFPVTNDDSAGDAGGTDDHSHDDGISHNHDGADTDHSHTENATPKILDTGADAASELKSKNQLSNAVWFTIGICGAVTSTLVLFVVYAKCFKKSATSKRYSAFGGPKKRSISTLNEAFVEGNSAGNDDEEVFARG